MAFVDTAKQTINKLPQDSAERLILESLLKKGVGHLNAQPWSAIESHLKANDFNSAADFPTRTLKAKSCR